MNHTPTRHFSQDRIYCRYVSEFMWVEGKVCIGYPEHNHWTLNTYSTPTICQDVVPIKIYRMGRTQIDSLSLGNVSLLILKFCSCKIQQIYIHIFSSWISIQTRDRTRFQIDRTPHSIKIMNFHILGSHHPQIDLVNFTPEMVLSTNIIGLNSLPRNI